MKYLSYLPKSSTKLKIILPRNTMQPQKALSLMIKLGLIGCVAGNATIVRAQPTIFNAQNSLVAQIGPGMVELIFNNGALTLIFDMADLKDYKDPKQVEKFCNRIKQSYFGKTERSLGNAHGRIPTNLNHPWKGLYYECKFANGKLTYRVSMKPLPKEKSDFERGTEAVGDFIQGLFNNGSGNTENKPPILLPLPGRGRTPLPGGV